MMQHSMHTPKIKRKKTGPNVQNSFLLRHQTLGRRPDESQMAASLVTSDAPSTFRKVDPLWETVRLLRALRCED